MVHQELKENDSLQLRRPAIWLEQGDFAGKGIAKRSIHQCRQALLVTALWTQGVESDIASGRRVRPGRRVAHRKRPPRGAGRILTTVDPDASVTFSL
jgi:hypothetical protein